MTRCTRTLYAAMCCVLWLPAFPSHGQAPAASQTAVSLIASPPGPAALLPTPEPADAEAAACALRRAGADAAAFRGIVVARSQTAGDPTLRDRLRAALPAEFSGLLLDLVPMPSRWDLIKRSAIAMGKHDVGAEAYQSCLELSLCLACSELCEIDRELWMVARGQALVRVVPATMDQDPRDPCGCAEHLRIACPMTGCDDPLRALWLTFHGPEYDVFARALKEQQGLIPVEEFTSRAVARARAEDSLWPTPEGDELRVSLPGREGTVAEVARELAALGGLEVEVAEAIGDSAVYCRCDDAYVTDALAALGAAVGGVLVKTDQGLSLTAPASLREQVCAAVPLELWASASLGGSERDLARLSATRDTWRAMAPQLADLRAGPLSMAQLDPEPRLALTHLVSVGAGGQFRRWLNNLPARDGAVPLWLLEQKMGPYQEYEVRAPTASCFFGGLEYLLVRCAIEGTEAIDFPLPPKEGKP